MKSKIKDLGSFYHGVNEDIDKIKHLCGICIKKILIFINANLVCKLSWINQKKDML